MMNFPLLSRLMYSMARFELALLGLRAIGYTQELVATS